MQVLWEASDQYVMCEVGLLKLSVAVRRWLVRVCEVESVVTDIWEVALLVLDVQVIHDFLPMRRYLVAASVVVVDVLVQDGQGGVGHVTSGGGVVV